MSHSKSCRCKICSLSSPVCNSYNPDYCSYNWKNRFCKLRKQWSEHSKCGSLKHISEDCTHCRSPCEKKIGRFGVAWVAEIPDCDNGDPKGWQVEILDTKQGILNKCKELIEWLNNPPAHLFDNIKGNESCNIQYSKCNLNNCDGNWDKPCPMQDSPCMYQDNKVLKKCRMSCCKDTVIEYPACCEISNPRLNERNNCKSQTYSCQKKYCNEQCQKTCSKTHDDSSDGENFKRRHSKYSWSTPVQNESDEIFRKESCCCQCHEKYFRNAATTYESDIVPQKDPPEDSIKSIHSQMDELDSKVICAHIRTSQICKKIKEEKRNQFINKHEEEINTVVGERSSDEDTARSLFMNSKQDNQSVINNNGVNNSIGSQRRSSKFRRKESI